MRPFAYRRAQDEAEAIALHEAGVAFVAGGTDFLQLWKMGVAQPELVVDLSGLPLHAIAARPDGGVSIGALARMSDVADHPLIRARLPLISNAICASASPQIRNAATIGGNLLQRTRCAYFRSEDLPCNKREPGSGCGAITGRNRMHAIFGGSPHCVATHASDLSVALVALDARVRLRSRAGDRMIAVEALARTPRDEPERDTDLRPGELVVAVEIPPGPPLSRYLKIRDRASFEFAVVSVAVSLRIDEGRVRFARVVAGGVGTKPWRLAGCEAALVGHRGDDVTFRAAAALASEGAAPLSQNGFKIELLERTVLRALQDTATSA